MFAAQPAFRPRRFLSSLLLLAACADDVSSSSTETDTDTGTSGMTVGSTMSTTAPPTTMTTTAGDSTDGSSSDGGDVTSSDGGDSSSSDGGDVTSSDGGDSSSSDGGDSSSSSDGGDSSSSSSDGGGDTCGDGIVGTSEACDTTDLSGETCATQGSAGGTLTCLADCSGFDTSGCVDLPPCVEEDIGSAVGPAVSTGTTVGEDEDLGQSCGAGGAVDRVIGWVAPGDGVFTFDTFGSTYDTVLAAYGDCSTASTLACNDDSGSTQSLISLAVSAGDLVVLAVSGFNGAAGPYTLNITEVPSGGPCCSAHAAPGCDEPTCNDQVCAADAACCDPINGWDQTCANIANTFCDVCNTPDICGNGILDGMNEACDGADVSGEDCESQGFDGGTLVCETDCSGLDVSGCVDYSGDCCTAHGPGEPGCDDGACVDTVCTADAFCCNDTWDQLCADAALGQCAVCFVPDVCGNGTIDGVGEVCDLADVGGEDCVSQGFDLGTLSCLPDCSALDTSQCFDAGQDCCAAQPTPGCSDATCEADICAIDDFCCDNTWDPICAAEAQGLCTVCGGGTGDCCNDTGDVGCADPECVVTICGLGGLDPSCCTGTWSAACTDLADANCTSCEAPGVCGNDLAESGEVCDGTDLDGGTCATQPGFIGGVLACDVDCFGFDTAGCVANGGGSCCADNGSPGCDDLACVEDVCATDPTCCDGSWDQGCADEAAIVCTACGGTPPLPVCAELDAGSATGDAIATGTTIGEDEDLAQTCGLNGAVDFVVYWTAPSAGSWVFTTFGSGYDTVLSLHSDCGPGTQLACNDDSGGVQSSLTRALAAGESILIAIAGYNGATGPFVLNINPAP